MSQFRIGYGYDAHRFAEGRPLILCGVEIPYERGLAALTDALLGALALGDIGGMFPDTEERFRGADSIELLKQAFASPEFRKWTIANVDLTIVAQRPKIFPFVPAMRERLASALGIGTDQVSIKGKTTEGMGFCGRGEGVEAYAAALLERK